MNPGLRLRAVVVACAALVMALPVCAAPARTRDDSGCRGRGRGLIAEPIPRGGETKADLGLTVRLDRAGGLYALDDELHLEIAAQQDVVVEVWQFDADSHLSRLLPVPGGRPIRVKARMPMRLPVGKLRLRVGPPLGQNELRIIARAADKSHTRGLQLGPLAGRLLRQERRACFRVIDGQH